MLELPGTDVTMWHHYLYIYGSCIASRKIIKI